MKKIIAFLLALVGLNTACGQVQDTTFENTDVNGFAGLITDTASVVILDVRTPGEFAGGHIAGAVNIDQGSDDFMEQARQQLPLHDATIAVYCRSGKRSASAARRLAAAGYRVVNLEGGIMAWTAASQPVTE